MWRILGSWLDDDELLEYERDRSEPDPEAEDDELVRRHPRYRDREKLSSRELDTERHRRVLPRLLCVLISLPLRAGPLPLPFVL